jgi:hypothetical protein
MLTPPAPVVLVLPPSPVGAVVAAVAAPPTPELLTPFSADAVDPVMVEAPPTAWLVVVSPAVDPFVADVPFGDGAFPWQAISSTATIVPITGNLMVPHGAADPRSRHLALALRRRSAKLIQNS